MSHYQDAVDNYENLVNHFKNQLSDEEVCALRYYIMTLRTQPQYDLSEYKIIGVSK